MSTSNVRLTITSDVLTAHEWSPPCDWYRLEGPCPKHKVRHPEQCPHPAFWAVVFAACPTPGCDRVTAPALWCKTHLVYALQMDVAADCEACGHTFRPFTRLIDSYTPIKEPPR